MSDEWTLTPDQWLFMHDCASLRGVIEDYLGDRVLTWIVEIMMTSEQWKALFGDMGFDEAYDRYECMTEGESAST